MFTVDSQSNRIRPVNTKALSSFTKSLTSKINESKLVVNRPAMPMTCLQATHKSSGFFVFGYSFLIRRGI